MAEDKPVVVKTGEILPPTSEPRPITIQEAADSYAESAVEKGTSKAQIKNVLSTVKKLEKAGYPPSTPLLEINNQEAMSIISSWSRENQSIVSSGKFGSALKTLINEKLPEGVSNAVSVWEAKNRGTKEDKYTKKEFGIRSTRRERKLSFPDSKTFHTAIHRAAMSLEDKEAKAALLIKLHTGLRNPDIFELSLEAKEGQLYGTVDTKTGTIYNISNKGSRVDYDLGQEVHSILKELSEDAQAEGRTKIFKQSEATLRNKINKAVNFQLEALDATIINTKTNTPEDFSIRDLRKNIFSILEEEVGAVTANQVIGHSVKKDVGLNYYKVKRQPPKGGLKTLDKVTRATELFTSIYAEQVGVDNPKDLYGKAYKFNADNFNESFVVGVELETPKQTQRVNVAETQVEVTTGNIEQTVDDATDRISKKLEKLEELSGKVTELTSPSSTTKKKAASDAADKKARSDNLNKAIEVFNSTYQKLPPPVQKAIPFIGTVAGGQAALQKAEAAEKALEEGRPIVGAIRTAQSVEEAGRAALGPFDPPVPTTGDLEDMVRLMRETKLSPEQKSGPLGLPATEISRQTNKLLSK